jgi:hypothetical protein
LKVGNIINFIDPYNRQITLTHRIVQTPNTSNGYKFVTRGDANKVNDPPISPSVIIGQERLAIPYIGNLTNFIKQPIGLILIIYIPALAIIIEEIRRLTAYYRNRQPYVAFGYTLREADSPASHWLSRATLIAALSIIPSAFFTLPAQAALQGRASLTGITISTAVATPPPPQCTDNNNIIINNSSSQSGASGSTSSSGNTIGGSSSSGSVTDSNSTSINIIINNC